MNVGFVGMGNMGQMLVTALARSGVLHPGDIYVTNRSHGKLFQLAETIPGIHALEQNAGLPARCPVIFLCIKPADTRAVLEEMSPYITGDHLLIIITNTIDTSMLERCTRARVAKVIPSVVQTVRCGVSLLMFGERCSAEDKALLHRLFSSISRPFVIKESQARVASDLTSCGPAFLSYAFRALSQAACQYQPDLPRETVDALIRQTAVATCSLLEQTGLSFDDVIAKVSTPGGVTADGIKVLDEQLAGVWEQVIETTIVKEEAKRAKVEL